MRRAGVELAALALADDAVLLDVYARDRPARVALMVGSEGDGLSGTPRLRRQRRDDPDDRGSGLPQRRLRGRGRPVGVVPLTGLRRQL